MSKCHLLNGGMFGTLAPIKFNPSTPNRAHFYPGIVVEVICSICINTYVTMFSTLVRPLWVATVLDKQAC